MMSEYSENTLLPPAVRAVDMVSVWTIISSVMLTVANSPVSLMLNTHAARVFYATQGILMCKN